MCIYKFQIQWYLKALNLDQYCYEALESVADNYMTSHDTLTEILNTNEERVAPMRAGGEEASRREFEMNDHKL